MAVSPSQGVGQAVGVAGASIPIMLEEEAGSAGGRGRQGDDSTEAEVGAIPATSTPTTRGDGTYNVEEEEVLEGREGRY